MTVSRRLLPSAFALGLLLATAAAHAEPSATQKETARGLMAEGRELRDQGDLDGALRRFNAADSLMGVPTTGFEVAATQAQLGRLVEARETLRRLPAIAPSADDPEPFNEARAKAHVLDQQLLARLGTLRFAVSGVSRAEALEVWVDAQIVPKAALSQPYRVNPGHHSVVARAGTREVDAVEARAVDVALSFPSDAAPGSAASADQPASDAPAAAPAGRGGQGLPMLAYVGGGVGALGLLVGTLTGISAISRKNAAKKDCVNNSCPPSTWSDLDSAHSLATGSTVAFVVGAIGLAVGVGAVLLGDDEQHSRQQAWVVSPDVGPQGARLTVAGKF